MVVWVNDLFGNSWYPAMWFNRLELWLICLWLWLPSLKFDIKDKKDRATLFVSAGVCSSFNSLKEQIRLTNPHWVTHSLPATNSCSKKRWSDAMPIYAPRIKKKTCFKDVQALSVVEPPRPQPNFKDDFKKETGHQGPKNRPPRGTKGQRLRGTRANGLARNAMARVSWRDRMDPPMKDTSQVLPAWIFPAPVLWWKTGKDIETSYTVGLKRVMVGLSHRLNFSKHNLTLAGDGQND